MSRQGSGILSVLRPPGQGLLTVSTGARQARQAIEKSLSQAKLRDWNQAAGVVLREGLKKKRPLLIGVPSDAGGGICRGAAHGPLWLRPKLYAKGWAKSDLGDVPCIPQLSHDRLLSARQKKLCGEALWGKSFDSSAPISPLNLLSALLEYGFKSSIYFKPMIIGGDHSISWSSFDALKKAGLSRDCALLHIDAHTDLMEERFGIEHCFATWTAHSLSTLKDPQQCVQVGLRQSQKDKAHWEERFGLRQLWMHELKKVKAKDLAERLCDHWHDLDCKRLYISIDIDGLDSKIAPSTGTPERAGLSLKFTEKLIKECSKNFNVVGADLVEVAPVLGSKKDIQKTLSAGARLIEAISF